MYPESERYRAFEQMEDHDIELQQRMLNRILSQFVELLGKEWIWKRTDRKRKL